VASSRHIHRRAFGLLFVSLVCIGMGQSMLFSILPPAARALGISPFQISTVFAVSASIWVFVSPWWGRMSDVWGRRPVILVGLLGYALSMSLLGAVITFGHEGILAAAAVYPLMIASRSLFALLGSGTGPASQAYVADRTTIGERAAAVAFMGAGMGLGETVGPGVGAVLVAVGLTAPLHLSAILAAASAFAIWRLLPETGPPHPHAATRGVRMRATDRRVVPFLIVGAALQAVRAITTITLALFLQDTLALSAEATVRHASLGFVVLAISSLVAQLILIQRLRPTTRQMLLAGLPLMWLACILLALSGGFGIVLVALAALGVGMGLVRPGSAAAASISVEPEEQGGVAGLLGGVTVVGNVFGPMLATSLYGLTPRAPYLLNATLMSLVVVFALRSRRVRQLRA
jgi:MFS family permease